MTLEELLARLVEQWVSDWNDLTAWPHGTLEELEEYIDIFPLVLSLLWSLSGLLSLVHNLVRRRRPLPEKLPDYTVLIPFFAEPAGALRTAASLIGVQPAPARIVLIDDGTPAGFIDEVELERRLAEIPGAELLRLPQNQGKAGALNAGLERCATELVVCLDADTVIVAQDWHIMLARFAARPELGGLTGKIRPADTGSLVERFQALDYLAVISLVKHAEDEWGGLMTVSGALAVFRLAALRACGGFNTSTAAEDIDMSWKLQARGWRLGLEPTWVAEVEMVPSWSALWRQRRRWSRGLGHTIRDHFGPSFFGRLATHLPVVLMVALTGLWMWSSLAVGVVRSWTFVRDFVGGKTVFLDALAQQSFVYLGICVGFFLIQLLIAEVLDRRPGRDFLRILLVAPLYPFYFAAISLTTYVIGFPQGFLHLDRGRWRRTVRLQEVQNATELPDSRFLGENAAAATPPTTAP